MEPSTSQPPISSFGTDSEPRENCALCPRLADFRNDNRETYPTFFNRPVPSFGSPNSRLLIVGLAPGLKGANQTGRPFTGDYAGDLLYETLLRYGFAEGTYDRRADDGLTLLDCRITNAVRCVPPENKPTTPEINACNGFLGAEIRTLPKLEALLCLGSIAHGAVLKSLGLKKSHCAFKHGAQYELPSGLVLADSYHCSRYNTNTGRLTTEMFRAVFQDLRTLLDSSAANPAV